MDIILGVWKGIRDFEVVPSDNEEFDAFVLFFNNSLRFVVFNSGSCCCGNWSDSELTDDLCLNVFNLFLNSLRLVVFNSGSDEFL